LPCIAGKHRRPGPATARAHEFRARSINQSRRKSDHARARFAGATAAAFWTSARRGTMAMRGGRHDGWTDHLGAGFEAAGPDANDPLLKADVPRIIRALEQLDLMTDDTMIAVDDGLPVIPRRQVPPT
jgi:hypothetical protein